MELGNDFMPGKIQACKCSQPKPQCPNVPKAIYKTCIPTCKPTQSKKERKKGKQRAHRPLLLGSVPSCAYAPADPTQALLFDVSQRRAAPAGGDSYYGARRTPDSSFSARSSLPSSLRLSQPSHGRPLSFLSSSIVTPVISVHALSGLVNAHCNAMLQVTHAHAAKLFT